MHEALILSVHIAKLARLEACALGLARYCAMGHGSCRSSLWCDHIVGGGGLGMVCKSVHR